VAIGFAEAPGFADAAGLADAAGFEDVAGFADAAGLEDCVPCFLAALGGADGLRAAAALPVVAFTGEEDRGATAFFAPPALLTAVRTLLAARLTLLPTDCAALRAFGFTLSTIFAIFFAAVVRVATVFEIGLLFPAPAADLTLFGLAFFAAEPLVDELRFAAVFFELFFAVVDRVCGMARPLRGAVLLPVAFFVLPLDGVDRAFAFVFAFLVAIHVLFSASRPQRGERSVRDNIRCTCRAA
jgi:hypothetical protein